MKNTHRLMRSAIFSVLLAIFLILPSSKILAGGSLNLLDNFSICRVMTCEESKYFDDHFLAFTADSIFNDSSVLSPPTITSMPPTPTISNTEQTISVTGSNFVTGFTLVVMKPDGSTVSIPPENVTPTSFTFRMVFNIAGTWCLRLTNPKDEQTLVFCFTVSGTPLPVISSISPSNPTPSTDITVIGINFQPGLTVTVFLPGGGTATLSGSQIQNVTPTSFVIHFSLNPGTYCIRVNNPNGGQSNQFCFTIISATAPVMTSISPPVPIVSDSDQTVDVFGGNFQTGLTMTVFFPGGGSGTLSGTQIMYIDPTHIKIIVTLNLIGTYGIRVNNPNDEQSNTFNFQTQAAIPSVTSISPTNPCVRNIDQTVTVNGNNFRVGLTVTVTFPNGGSATLSGTQIQNVTATSFTMVITFGNPGTYSIRVNNPGGAQSNNLPVPTQNCLSVNAINPQIPMRSNLDQDVVVTGSNFVAGLTVIVTFPNGGTVILSGAQILNVSPGAFTMRITLNDTGTWHIKARLPNGNLSNSFSFTVKGKGVFDFDGDGRTDISIFRPPVGEWWINQSSSGQTVAAQFGLATDKPTPGDFTGDGKTDIAFWRSSTGEWFILRSENASFLSFPFGTNGDIPVVGDFDGDGKDDPGVFRPSTGEWFILKSTGGVIIITFGVSGDKPVPADYDGDGKADISVFRPPDGSWWYLRSSDGQFRVFRFGVSTDKPVPGDYTGDGKSDIAVWRPATGEWFIQRSEDNSFYSLPFGTTGDFPAPGDFDGDGRFDTAVFRPSTSTWFVQRSTAGILILGFGQNGDRPLPSTFVP